MRHLNLLLILVAVSACKRTTPPGDQPAQSVAAAVAAPVVETEERAAAFRAIQAELRKRLAADRAVIANKLGYEQAVQRHKREMKEAGMERRMPTTPLNLTDLRELVREHAQKNGLTVSALNLGQLESSTPLPERHAGPGPYGYEIDQIFDRFPVSLKVHPGAEGRLRSFYAGLKSAVFPSLDLVAVRLTDSAAVFTGYVYRRLDVMPPRHVPRTPTPQEAAEAAGVKMPTGHPRLSETHGLIAEHGALLPALQDALVVLGRVHLLGLQKRFFQERIQAMDHRPFPRPVGTSSAADATDNPAPGAKP